MRQRELLGTTDLMNVVVNMLAGDDWCNRVCFFRATFSASILELRTFLLKTSLDGIWIAMLMLAVLNRDDVVSVLFREHLTILDWLHGRVVMVLVDLAVNGGRCLFMTGLLDFLIHNGGSNLLVHGGVMMASFVPKRGQVSVGGSTGATRKVG